MKKFFFLIVLTFVALACSIFTPAVVPTEMPTATEAPVMTEPPTATEPVVPTDVPTPTLEPTSEPTAVPTVVLLPQQWNGYYTYQSGQRQNLSLIIEKLDGTDFSGKMVWQNFGRYKGAILRMEGYYVTDFGDAVEQAKWGYHEDFDGDKSGTWLKWTETKLLDGPAYTVNGWYYAHIRENGTMVAIYFFSKDATVPDSGIFVFERLLP